MRLFACALVFLFLAVPTAFAESLPRAIYTDPPNDPNTPARMEVLHIPSGDVKINGIAYIPSGPGPHPAVLLLHGMPGNEKNLDLAQSMRRAGWTVVAINYRGSWGSPGTFHFAQTFEDAASALAYLRLPETAMRLRIDTTRIVLVGHSMGGWIGAHSLASDPRLLGAALISPADIGRIGKDGRDAAEAFIEDDRETIVEAAQGALTDEMIAHADDWQIPILAPQLAGRRLLVLYSNDAYKTDAVRLIDAVRAANSKTLTIGYTATDHAWSDHRIALQAQVINWLETLPAR